MAHFGVAVRLFFGNLFSMQDFHSNILNSKQGFCWWSLVSQQDFFEKFGFASTLSFRHFEFEAQLLLAHFGFAVRFLLRNLVSMQLFHGFNASISWKHFEFQTRLLLAQFGFAVTLLLRNYLMQDFHSKI